MITDQGSAEIQSERISRRTTIKHVAPESVRLEQPGARRSVGRLYFTREEAEQLRIVLERFLDGDQLDGGPVTLPIGLLRHNLKRAATGVPIDDIMRRFTDA